MSRQSLSPWAPFSVILFMVFSNIAVAFMLLFAMEAKWLPARGRLTWPPHHTSNDESLLPGKPQGPQNPVNRYESAAVEGTSMSATVNQTNRPRPEDLRFLYSVPEGVSRDHRWRYSSHGLFWKGRDALTERFTSYIVRRQLGDIQMTSDPVARNVRRVARVLRSKGRDQLARMFENSYSNTLEKATTLLGDATTYIITGDIPLMWLRDSSAQVHHYLPLLNDDPFLRAVVEGLIRRQMLFILMDPYGSSFRMFLDFDHVGKEELTDWDFQSGRTIHVAMHNYEPDSLCYFLRLCYRYWNMTGQTEILDDTWHRTARLIIQTLRKEQNHNTSEYFYPELSSQGRGTDVCHTGMTWVGFRPSDDPCQYHYNIPVNMFAVVSLMQLAEIADEVYKDRSLAGEARLLAHEIDNGIHRFGVYNHTEYGLLYAYEVDGCGGYVMMDDANVPSLLSIPYLGFTSRYDSVRKIASNTRAFVLSTDNPFFFNFTYRGIGSPHIAGPNIWHMSLIIQALTSESIAEVKEILSVLEKTTAETGEVMHESFFAEDPTTFTREWFGWASALFSELIQQRLHDISPKQRHRDEQATCNCPNEDQGDNENQQESLETERQDSSNPEDSNSEAENEGSSISLSEGVDWTEEGSGGWKSLWELERERMGRVLPSDEAERGEEEEGGGAIYFHVDLTEKRGPPEADVLPES